MGKNKQVYSYRKNKYLKVRKPMAPPSRVIPHSHRRLREEQLWKEALECISEATGCPTTNEKKF